MSELEQKIKKDMNEALKNKQQNVLSALRMLRAAIEEKSISKNKEELTDADVIKVIKKETKKIKDSIEAFKQGKREDLVEKEQSALKILKEYLPPEISDEKIKEVINKIIDEVKPEGKKDFGQVMGRVMAELKGAADGSLVQKLVNEELSKLE
jgi:hypothetical protein